MTVLVDDRRCEVCGGSLKHMRADARVCGSGCRAERARRRLKPQRPHSAYGHCRCGQHLRVVADPDGALHLPYTCPACGADPPLLLVTLAQGAARRQNRSYNVQKGRLCTSATSPASSSRPNA